MIVSQWKTREEKEAIVMEMAEQCFVIIQSHSNGRKPGAGGLLYFEKKKPDLSDLLRRIVALEAKIK